MVEKRTGRECFVRRGVTDFVHYDEELPWVMLVHAAGKIHYFKDKLMSWRGVHQDQDKVEFLYKDKFQEAYYLGPMAEIMKPSANRALCESHEDLCVLMEVCDSQYNAKCIKNSIMRILWALITQYHGAGLYSEDTKYCHNQMRVREWSRIIKNPSKFFRFVERYSSEFWKRLFPPFLEERKKFQSSHEALRKGDK